jgi:hypothetical protein
MIVRGWRSVSMNGGAPYANLHALDVKDGRSVWSAFDDGSSTGSITIDSSGRCGVAASRTAVPLTMWHELSRSALGARSVTRCCMHPRSTCAAALGCSKSPSTRRPSQATQACLLRSAAPAIPGQGTFGPAVLCWLTQQALRMDVVSPCGVNLGGPSCLEAAAPSPVPCWLSVYLRLSVPCCDITSPSESRVCLRRAHLHPTLVCPTFIVFRASSAT